MDVGSETSIQRQLGREHHPDAKESVSVRSAEFQERWKDEMKPEEITAPWVRIREEDMERFWEAAGVTLPQKEKLDA